MEEKRQHGRQDYSPQELFAGFDLEGQVTEKEWEDEVFPGGIYSFSEVGGSSLDQQNPWEGTQAITEQGGSDEKIQQRFTENSGNRNA